MWRGAYSREVPPVIWVLLRCIFIGVAYLNNKKETYQTSVIRYTTLLVRCCLLPAACNTRTANCTLFTVLHMHTVHCTLHTNALQLQAASKRKRKELPFLSGGTPFVTPLPPGDYLRPSIRFAWSGDCVLTTLPPPPSESLAESMAGKRPRP